MGSISHLFHSERMHTLVVDETVVVTTVVRRLLIRRTPVLGAVKFRVGYDLDSGEAEGRSLCRSDSVVQLEERHLDTVEVVGSPCPPDQREIGSSPTGITTSCCSSSPADLF